jgi:tRNA pseudouridine55 synthase
LKKEENISELSILTKHNLPSNIDFTEGQIILVNKPLEWTSFDVVNKIKYAIKYNHHLKKIKIGHAGTLDPMAEGLLIICTGRYTKLLDTLSINDKSYIATIKLGVTTASYDRESPEENSKEIDHISNEIIDDTIMSFEGEQDQVPPIFSAVKIKGKNAYTLARKGKTVELKSRKIKITKISNIDIAKPLATFHCAVSKGTYIRSLANDIGEKLGCGAYLVGLHRDTIGIYKSEDALDLDSVIQYIRTFNPEYTPQS